MPLTLYPKVFPPANAVFSAIQTLLYVRFSLLISTNSPSRPKLLDGQGREQKLRFPSRHFRMHQELPYTAQHLYRNSAHAGSRHDRDSN